ncbi:MAG: Wzz/FepE/Etk N-terminal domain-containing protein [Bacteroidia bacterium]|jgi:uncharacterized protein involved in exopolysaccharide biosynthesis
MDEEEEKGINLVDTIKFVREFLTELKQSRFIIFIIICLVTLNGIVVAVLSKPKYIAASTVMLEASKGGSMSGAMALASQFGLLNGGGGEGAMNEDKLLEIIKSETIVKAALFEERTIKGNTDILANHAIEILGYKEKWENHDSLKGFHFEHSKENLTLKENTVFKMLYGLISNEYLKADKSKGGLITITVTTGSEVFSKCLNENLVKSMINLYVDRITKKGRKNVDIIQKRVDSVALALKDAEFALARWKDGSNQLVKVQGMINEIKLRRAVEVNNSMYVEGVKQLEIAKFSLLDQTPFLQVIDQPTFPLAKKGKISLMKGGVAGGVIGCVLAAIFVWLRRKYLELRVEWNSLN